MASRLPVGLHMGNEAALEGEHDLPPLPMPLGPAGEFTAEQMLIYGLAVRAWDADKPDEPTCCPTA